MWIEPGQTYFSRTTFSDLNFRVANTQDRYYTYGYEDRYT